MKNTQAESKTSNLPERANSLPSVQKDEVFPFAINYIFAILAGKITVEAACNVLHAKFPHVGFDRAKAEYVRDKQRIERKRVEKASIIISSCD